MSRFVIVDFLERTRGRSHGANEWLVYEYMEVYVRRGVHSLGRRLSVMYGRSFVATFDIANVNIPDPEMRGKGLFKQFVLEVESVLMESPELRGEIMGIYVENVFPEWFRSGLLRMGFESTESIPPCYFSPLPMPFGKAAEAHA